MRILVTGGKGMLGSAIKAACKDRDEEFIFDTRIDLTLDKKTKELMEMHRPQVVIHCAAKVGGVKLNSEHPEEMYYENILLNAHTVHHAALTGVKKFIAFGSNCAYGDVDELTRFNIHDGEPFKSNRAYGYAKRMLEVHLRAAKDQYGMDFCYVVPVSLFGEGDNFNLENGHVIASLIHKCHLAKDELPLWGDGSPVREVVYVGDVAKIVLDLIDKRQEYQIIGTGQSLSIKEMAETITKAMDFQGKIVWDESKPAGQKTRPPAFKSDYLFTPFQEAINKTCKWFKKQYPKVRC